jgi:DNA-binding CsgD family transcriptional regulator/tetratricopeptide (TPR) repeat protein
MAHDTKTRGRQAVSSSRTLRLVADRRSELLASVGRERERERVEAALSDPSVAGVVIRAGPCGGAEDFAIACAGRGAVVITADETSQSLPLACLSQFVQPVTHADIEVDVDVDRLNLVVGSLLAASDGSPIVVDDAGYLDAASSLVISEVARRGAPICLVSGRTTQLSPALARAARGFAIVELDDLSDAAVSELAAAVLGGPVEPRVIRSLTRLVGGASAAIADVLEAAVASGSLAVVSGVWRQCAELDIPPSTQTRLVSVIDPLRPAELDALDLISLGIAVPDDVLDELIEPDAIVALEAFGLVGLASRSSSAASNDSRISIVDTVVASARTQHMGDLRSRHLARRLHDSLRSTHHDVHDTDLVVLAAVRLAARLVSTPADAVEAARAAHKAGELRLAVRLCEAIAERDTSIESTILLAELLTESGRNREAEVALRDVVASTDQDRALVAMTRAVNLAFHLDEVDDGIALLDATIADLSVGSWAAEVIGLRAVVELMLGRPGEALRRVESMLELGSGREFVEAATAAGPALAIMGRCLSCAELAQTSLDERLALGDQAFLEAAGLHAVVRAFGLAESGQFAEADELTSFVLSAASDMAIANGIMWAGVVRGRSLLDQGRYPEAFDAFDMAGSAALDLNLSVQLGWARGGALLAVAQMGDRAGTQQALDALHATPPTPLGMMASEVERARAWAAIAIGNLAEGAERLRAAAEIGRASGEAGMELLALHDLVRIWRPDLVDRLVELGDVVEGDMYAVRVSHGRAFASGDAEELERVAERFATLGAPVFAAEATNHASWFERRRGRLATADRLRARVATICASRPWASTPGLASHPGLAELTRREREIAWLVAAGTPSKEVAQRLGVSVRTVDNLLQRVYRKLGIAGRAELRDLRIG